MQQFERRDGVDCNIVVVNDLHNNCRIIIVVVIVVVVDARFGGETSDATNAACAARRLRCV